MGEHPKTIAELRGFQEERIGVLMGASSYERRIARLCSEFEIARFTTPFTTLNEHLTERTPPDIQNSCQTARVLSSRDAASVPTTLGYQAR